MKLNVGTLVIGLVHHIYVRVCVFTSSILDFIFFFFSSRRRHTRFDCDWSSDVCSSDLDMDYFKRINDTLGHPAGDAVLAAAGKRLANTLRDNETLLRWGGEEFLVLDRKSTRLNSSHSQISYAVFCLKKKKKKHITVWHKY